MKHLAVTIIFVLTAIVVTACTGVRGNGNVIEESRDVSGFDKIELSGVGIINITQGETESLTIAAESNLMSLLRSDVRNNTLILGTEPNRNINPTRDIVFTLTVIDLSRIDVSGAGTIETSELEVETLTLELSGASKVTIESIIAKRLDIKSSGSSDIRVNGGEVTEQSLTISGAGKYDARDLESNSADITISGSGNATVAVSEGLSGQISGSGNINYVGSPTMNVDISGSGSMNRLDTD